MFDIGFQELILIFVVALLVFGPEKLPEIGRTMGKWIIDIRNGIHNVKMQMDTEFSESGRMGGKGTEMSSGAEGEKEKEGQAPEGKKEDG
jgi:Tat protein translocase TatB subunit